MKKKKAKNLIKITRKTYNKMAGSFDKTRGELWKKMEKLTEAVEEGDRVLDIGCGNGRLAKLFKKEKERNEKGKSELSKKNKSSKKKIEYIGVDYSKKLIKIAKKRHPNFKFIKANVFNLPFSKNSFDVIFSIAMLHHIPTKKMKEKAIKEAKRVLKKNGIMIFSVWNLNRKEMKKKIEEKKNKFKRIDNKNVIKYWRNKKKYPIYYHIFNKKELKELFRELNFKVEIESRKNYWVKTGQN